MEIYPTKTYAPDSPQTQDQLDSSRSVSPGGTWNSPNHLNNNVRAVDRIRARQDGHSTGQYKFI